MKKIIAVPFMGRRQINKSLGFSPNKRLDLYTERNDVVMKASIFDMSPEEIREHLRPGAIKLKQTALIMVHGIHIKMICVLTRICLSMNLKMAENN